MFCSNCGYEINESTNFCPSCGSKIAPQNQRNSIQHQKSSVLGMAGVATTKIGQVMEEQGISQGIKDISNGIKNRLTSPASQSLPRDISLECPECGGVMDKTTDTELVCPYCGHKKAIIESDAVRKRQLTKDMIINGQDKFAELAILKEKNKEEGRIRRSEIFKKILVGYAILFVIAIIFLIIFAIVAASQGAL